MTETRPTFVLSAAPLEAAHFKKFFDEAGPRTLLERPQGLRNAGFDMDAGSSEARIVRGEYLEVGNRDWKLIRLYEDGTLVARVPADEDFLGWAATRRVEKAFWTNPKINPIALVEFVYTFTELYSRAVRWLDPLPNRVRFRAELRNVINGEARLYLTPHGVEGLNWMTEHVKYPAPATTMQRQIEPTTTTLTKAPQQVAYSLLERIYTWFGAAPDVIPYVSTNDVAERVVDVDLLKVGGKRAG